MKKLLLLLSFALGSVGIASAQDLICRTDSTKVEARVTEISQSEVRYKRFSNPDGPTYVVPTSEVAYIQYPNGEREFFTKAPQAEAPAPAPAPVAPQEQYILQRYKVGDLYEANGVKGVVCEVSDDGLHGKILSLHEVMISWSEFRKPDYRLVGTESRDDGRVNMETVARYIAENGLSWADFPAYQWCREQGEGWYLPAIDELLVAGHNFNGGSRVTYNRKARNHFNQTLKDAGGERMDRLVYYFSSTEVNEKEAFVSHTSMEPPYVDKIPKHNKFLVRAMYRF